MTRPYVKVEYASQEDWLEERRKVVTATEVAALFGEHPFLTAEQLAANKRSRNDIPVNRQMWWGIHLEPSILKAFQVFTGVRIRPTHSMLRSTRAPVSATLDGLVYCPEHPSGEHPDWVTIVGNLPQGLGVIDAKNVSARSRSRWLREAPKMYWWQIQTQTFVTGLDFGILVAKIDSSEMVAHVVEADADAHDAIQEAATAFMERL